MRIHPHSFHQNSVLGITAWNGKGGYGNCLQVVDECRSALRIFFGKDIEGCSADIKTTTLDALVEAVVNQKSNYAKDDYLSTILESAQADLDAIMEGVAALVDDLPLEVVKPSEEIVSPHSISDKYASGSKAIEDEITELKQKFAFDDFIISDDMSRHVIKEYKKWVEEGLLKFHAKKNIDSSPEIHKLAVMLSTYLSKSGFFKETTRTDWANLDAYRNKMGQRTQLVNQHSFEIEYVQNITQQECDKLYGDLKTLDLALVLLAGVFAA
ncbi:hypothetical protein BC332_26392 [Capsicum chinense]|nr:hypothetical protein BC332_26392 [Capsicum chinense]